LLELLLPRCCVVCGARLADSETQLACGPCWTRIPALAQPQCARCGYPERDDVCRWCQLLPPFVRAARSVTWVPVGVGGRLVHALKYDGWWRLADEMAARMARLALPPDVVAERAALIPVPLSPRRQRERGYNQSDQLATGLGKRWGVPVWRHALVRHEFTASQTRLTPDQRLTNVAGAFRVPADVTRLRGLHVLLVDDVVTTAATMNACATALFDGGARMISYVTFGRARLPGDAPT
jgi:ComF family protein